MVSNEIKFICPRCGAEESKQVEYTLIETDLLVFCECDKCKAKWHDTFGLYYLGYHYNKEDYDRDNLKIRCQDKS